LGKFTDRKQLRGKKQIPTKRKNNPPKVVIFITPQSIKSAKVSSQNWMVISNLTGLPKVPGTPPFLTLDQQNESEEKPLAGKGCLLKP
jgi:hypothetical protein